VRYANRFFQLERQSRLAPARSIVQVRENVTGQIEIRYRDHVMRWTELAGPVIAAAGAAPSTRAAALTPPTGRRRPCADHPWKHGAAEYVLARQLAADRRARAAVEP
jgi:hypothetical protein